MSKYIFLGKHADNKTLPSNRIQIGFSPRRYIGEYYVDVTTVAEANEIYVDDDILELIVVSMKHSEFPLLFKIVEDFYEDFVIETEKLKDLKQEINKFISTFRKKVRDKIFLVKYKTIEDYPKLLEFLKKLEKLCDEGNKKKLTLWGDAD